MHPEVRKLLDVQKVDQKFARLQRSLDSIPRERAQRQTALDKARAAHQARVDALKTLEVQQRESEVAIKGTDETIKKLEVRLNTAKNNAEYQATLLAIESTRKQRAEFEEDGLQLIDAIDTKRAEVDASKAELDAAETEFQEFVAEGDKFLAEKQQEFEELKAGRGRELAEVESDLRELYSRIFEARQGNAVVAVEGMTCTGCYTSVPPNLMMKLQAGSAVVQCDACQRILYLPE